MISAAQRSLRDWLADIVEWGGAVQHYVAGTDADALRRDKMRLHALAKCVESIGEASSQLLKLAPELQRRFPELELREAASTRNRLIPGYFDINPDLLWLAASTSVPSNVRAATSALAILDQEKLP